MKGLLLGFFLFSAVTAHGLNAPFFFASKPETRCGWFENPTPANAWLIDGSGEWTVGTQGGQQADGDWPSFKPSQWIKTNGSYGRGCACMKVETDRSEMRIVKIISAYAKPISACRTDKALRRKEPK